METAYDGRQVVGMDLHRRRSVLVRMTQDGRRLGTARITNSPQELRAQIARAGTLAPDFGSRPTGERHRPEPRAERTRKHLRAPRVRTSRQRRARADSLLTGRHLSPHP